jgi:hypothetical protein
MRLLEHGVDPGVTDFSRIQPPKAKKNSLEILVDVLNTPNYTMAGFMRGAMSPQGDAINQAWKGLSWQDRRGFASVLEQGGVQNKYIKGGLGFAMDVGLDPTTYLTLGFGAAAKKGARLGLAGMQDKGHSLPMLGYESRTITDPAFNVTSKQGLPHLDPAPQAQFMSSNWKETKPVHGFAQKGWKTFYDTNAPLEGKLAKTARQAMADQGGIQFKFPGAEKPITIVSSKTLNDVTRGWIGAPAGERSGAYKWLADQDGWLGNSFRKMANKSFSRHLPPAMAAAIENTKFLFENEQRQITKMEAEMFAQTRSVLGDPIKDEKAFRHMDEYFEFDKYDSELDNKSEAYRNFRISEGSYDEDLTERAIAQAEGAEESMNAIRALDHANDINYKPRANYKPKYREFIEKFAQRNRLSDNNKRRLGGLSSAQKQAAADYDIQAEKFPTLESNTDPSQYIPRRIGDSLRAHSERRFLDDVKRAMTDPVLAAHHSSGLGTAFSGAVRLLPDGTRNPIQANDSSFLLEGWDKMSEATIATREAVRQSAGGELPEGFALRLSDNVIDEIRDVFNPYLAGKGQREYGLFFAEGKTDSIRGSRVTDLVGHLNDIQKGIDPKKAFNLGATVLPRPYVIDFIQRTLSPEMWQKIDIDAGRKGTEALKDFIIERPSTMTDVTRQTGRTSVKPDELHSALAEIQKADPEFFGSAGFQNALQGLKGELKSDKVITGMRADKEFGLDALYGTSKKAEKAYKETVDDILGEMFEEDAPEDILKALDSLMSNKASVFDEQVDMFNQLVHMDSRNAAWALPVDVADMLNDVIKVGGQGESSLGMKGVRKILNWWKGVATRYTPGYWIRNKMGAISNMMLGGMTNPADYVRLNRISKDISGYIRKREKYDEMVRSGLADKAELPDLNDYKSFRLEGDRLMVDVNDQMSFDVEDLWRNELDAKGVRHTGLVGADFEKTLQDYQKTTLRKYQPKNMWDNMWGKRDRLFDFLERHMEDREKITYYLWNLENGSTSDEAVKQVKDYLFNYADIGDWDRRYGKFALPFWTWIKKNTALQLRRATEVPGAYGSFGDLQRNSEEMAGVSAEDKEYMPAYMRKLSSFGVPNPFEAAKDAGVSFNSMPFIGKAIDGLASNPLFLNPNVPIQELARLPVDSSGVNSQPILSGLHPFLRGPMELMLNHSVYYERPIEPGREHGERLWVDMPPLYQGVNNATGQSLDLLPWTRTRVPTYSPSNQQKIQWTGTAAHVLGQALPPLAQFAEVGVSDSKSVSSAGSTLGGVKLISFKKEKEITRSAFEESKRLQALVDDARRRGIIPPTEEAQQAYKARLRTGGY